MGNLLKRKLLAASLLFLMPVAAVEPLTEQLYELLDVCGVSHDGTLPSIVQATQAAWLRKPLQERWQLEEKDFSEETKERIRTLLDQMGFIREVLPTENHYAYCLIGGATYPSFQKRVHYVASLWEQGFRFDQIVLLSGDRDLDPVMDRVYLEMGCKNEAEGVLAVYQNSPLPDEMRFIPVTVAKASKQSSPLGLVRPTRGDTIRAWLALSPLPGTCLFVTHQPYVLYDNAVAACFLGPDYPFATAGLGTTAEKNSIAVLLDNTARWLYQELEYRKAHP